MHNSNIRWYAVRTKPQHENVVRQMLEFQGYEQILPTYRTRVQWADRVKEVERPLFPGYLFCRFDGKRRVPVLTTPGVIDIVRLAGHPAPILDEEVASLKLAMASGYTCLPWPRAEIGTPVRIGFGPLAGVRGTVVAVKGQNRIVLSVSIVNRAVLVETDPGLFAPEATPRPAGRSLTTTNVQESLCADGRLA